MIVRIIYFGTWYLKVGLAAVLDLLTEPGVTEFPGEWFAKNTKSGHDGAHGVLGHKWGGSNPHTQSTSKPLITRELPAELGLTEEVLQSSVTLTCATLSSLRGQVRKKTDPIGTASSAAEKPILGLNSLTRIGHQTTPISKIRASASSRVCVCTLAASIFRPCKDNLKLLMAK